MFCLLFFFFFNLYSLSSAITLRNLSLLYSILLEISIGEEVTVWGLRLRRLLDFRHWVLADLAWGNEEVVAWGLRLRGEIWGVGGNVGFWPIWPGLAFGRSGVGHWVFLGVAK